MATPRQVSFVAGLVLAMAVLWAWRLDAAEPADPAQELLKRAADEARSTDAMRERARPILPAPERDRGEVLLDEVRVEQEFAKRSAVSALRAARGLRDAGRLDEARQKYREARTFASPFPNDPAMSRLARIAHEELELVGTTVAEREAAQAAAKLGAARELAARENERTAERRADRIALLLANAKAHVEQGDLSAAERALTSVLQIDPSNTAARSLRETVVRERERREAERVSIDFERQRTSAFRAVDRAAVPQSQTLVRPEDAAERSARARAAAVPPGRDAKARKAAMQRTLAKTISIEAIEMTMTDFAEYVRRAAGVDVIVDKDAADQTVSLKLTDAAVSSVLNWATELAGLAYSVDEHAIFIAPAARLPHERVVRVYDVSDILYLRRAISQKFKVNGWSVVPDDKSTLIEQEEGKSFGELSEELIHFLKDASGRKNWEDAAAGRMNVYSGKLVVNQTPELQDAVEEIIEKLRP